jgi:hypothetical protein
MAIGSGKEGAAMETCLPTGKPARRSRWLRASDSTVSDTPGPPLSRIDAQVIAISLWAGPLTSAQAQREGVVVGRRRLPLESGRGTFVVPL